VRRALLRLAAVALGLALVGCGGNKSWSCNWQCTSNETSGTHAYSDGPDPTSQCEADFGSTCNDFSCSCTQG